MRSRRTIEEVQDLESGTVIQADEIFQKSFDELTIIRSELEKANQGLRDKWLVCSVCGENVRMLGGKSKRESARSKNWHFAHLHNSNDCPIKTTSRYTKEDINRMKYRGATESVLHVDLKNKIAQGLYLNQTSKQQVSSINIEKTV